MIRPRTRTGYARAHAEDGSVTLWIAGLCVVLLLAGGMSLDLWRGLGERQALANLADAAAVAGAQAIDVAHFRATGDLHLDPAAAQEQAYLHVTSADEPASLTGLTVHADPEAVTVTATGQVPLTLLGLADLARQPWVVRVHAVAHPRAIR